MSNAMARTVTAAVLLIGDELLSGRTQDTNLKTIAEFLAPLGVEVCEARTIRDVHATIVSTVQHLRKTYDYLFTTGGIGPTHDDITADAIAAVFERRIGVRADALALLEAHYAGRGMEINEGRRRMARIPDGALLIANPVSAAPGFQIGNVFVMAGVPSVMRGMLQQIGDRIDGGEVVQSHTVRGKGLLEGNIAGPLAEIARAAPGVNFGSYPWMRPGGPRGPDFGVNLVARGRDPDTLAAAVQALAELVRAEGVKPEIDPKD
ncbi:MAG: molybdopterin-binding protein [Alphaproteobacteria bacterium]|nr:molybdopterin-binding protein [Alphaproteobacteria bacterium]